MSDNDQEHQDEEVSCEACDETIVIDSYMDTDDIVTCEECGAEYLIESRNPLVLEIIDEDEDEDDIDFYDDYS